MNQTTNRSFWLGLFILGLIHLTPTPATGTNPWPLYPMDVQHDISSTFGECREDRNHFHDGVDMPLGQGGAVLSVANGTVLDLDPSGINAYIRVGRYCYVHVTPHPDLQVGEAVETGDVVGTTNDQGHIHFKDGGGASGTPIINPLRSDGLAPFQDPYRPTVQTIKFYENGTTNIFPTAKISGLVDIVSRSFDKTDNSTWGGNNGIYSIGWEVFAADETTSVHGPYFPYTFDTIPSNSYIRNVYFQGSNTSTYYYIITNQVSHDSFWDTRWVEPGPYLVSVYCCDTRDNWDTTSVWVEVSEQDVLPPEMPVLASTSGNRESRLTVSWQPGQGEDLKGYRLYHSYDGLAWFCNYDEEDLSDTTAQLAVDGFQKDRAIYFKLSAVDSAAIPNESAASDIYGTRLTELAPKVLIVDGFDRTSDSWTQPSHPFAASHAKAMDALQTAFDCCSNEAVVAGDVLLGDYDAVIWLLGDEGVEDSTFAPTEQSLVTAYLQAGGDMFISGSEVGYDLVEMGSVGDAQFYQDILRAQYVADDAAVNQVQGLPGTIFEGLDIAFDDGSHGIYQENYPDAIAPSGGSVANLSYSGTSFWAGLQYQGIFGDGAQEGRLVYLGFPFETIYPEDLRIEVMGRVLSFFQVSTSVEPERAKDAAVPDQFVLHQNYPNPFNPSTTIAFSLPDGGQRPTTLRIYNILGQQVRVLLGATLGPGAYTLTWDGRDDSGRQVGSGVYFLSLQAGPFSATKKMTLLK